MNYPLPALAGTVCGFATRHPYGPSDSIAELLFVVPHTADVNGVSRSCTSSMFLASGSLTL
jgi:hypothetical protein